MVLRVNMHQNAKHRLIGQAVNMADIRFFNRRPFAISDFEKFEIATAIAVSMEGQYVSSYQICPTVV